MEDMNAEKALTILKIPKNRSNANFSMDRKVLDDSFKSILHKRVKVKDVDPGYTDKIEQRHILEGRLGLFLFNNNTVAQEAAHLSGKQEVKGSSPSQQLFVNPETYLVTD